MKRKFNRTLSRVLASVMVMSSLSANIVYSDTTFVDISAEELQAYADDVTSGSGLGDEVTSGSGLTAAQPGKTYTADFVAEEAGALDGRTFAEGTIKAVASEQSDVRSDAHGTTNKPGDKFEISVAGGATISVVNCVYGTGTWTLTNSKGDVIGTIEGKSDNADGEEQAISLDYEGEADTLTLTYDGSGQTYVHSISVRNDALPTGEAESFELWFDDIAKDVDGGLDADGNPTVVKTFEQQEFKYKDTSVKLVGNVNTNYEDGLERFTPNNNNANFMNLDRGGRTGVNAYKAGNRNANANDITAIPNYGDGTALLITPAANGTVVAYVYTGSFVRIWDFDAATGERYGYTDTDTGVEYAAFKAEAGHTYVLSTTGKTNNCGFCGVEYTVDENTTVAVKSWETPEDSTYNFSNSTFKVVDSFLGTEAGTINANTTSLKLAKGHSYTVKSADPGVGVAFKESGTDTIKITDDVTSVQLSLVEIPDVTLTGDFLTSDGKDAKVTAVSFKNKVSGTVTEAVISEDGKSYSASIKPGDYDTSVTVDGYSTSDHVKVASEGENTNVIYLKADDPSLINLPADVQKTEGQQVQYISASDAAPVRYNNDTSIRASAGDKIVIPVSGKQKVTVAGWYSGTWDINGQNSVTTSSSANAANPTTTSYFTDGTETSVTVNLTGDGANYLYWIKIDDVNEFDASNTVIQVPSEQFPTLKDANAYIATLANRPEGEEGRITIELTDDLEEQIVFTEPYITLKGNGHQISWYYGVGSFYYSIDPSTGLYDEELFYDKYSSAEGNGSLWGGVAIIRGDHFVAEDTTFKNTYNYEVTEKDAADFEHSTGGLVTERKVGTDVAIYSTKERSNAFYIEAKDIEVYNCKILSSQDTFGRNGSANNGYSVYVKDSVIGGNVDYICGEFTAVFDNVELQWKTYSDDKNNDKIGYIVAPKTSPYIFRNCEITQDDASKTVTGQYGRTWGAGSNATFYATETNGTINAATAWGQMSAGDTDATFYEYQNTSKGEAFTALTSSAEAVVPAELPEALVASYTTDDVIKDVLGGWEPVHYDESAADGDLGDVDGVEGVTANDASIAYQIALVSTFGDDDPAINKALAEVDGEEGISAADAAWILQKALISTTVFPVEEGKSDDDKKDDEKKDDEKKDDENTDLAATTVYVVGDSTGCDYAPTADAGYYYKRVGFGTRLGEYLNDKATVVNYALSGRSSKSFLEEANYTSLKNNIKEGDYLIIAFGHNDEKADDAARYTEPLGDKDTAGSFKNSLYVNYVKLAQDAGATPILVTPIVRRATSDKWSDNQLHIANGKSYSEAVVELGQETGVTVVDATTLTKTLYDELTPAGSVDLHAWTSSNPASVDNTHLNNYGAAYVSYLIANDIKSSDNSLKDYVGDITAPEKEANLKVNPDYVEASSDDLTAEDLKNDYFKTTEPFYGTVFGDIGGQSKVTAQDEDGNMIPGQLGTDSTGETYYFIGENEDGSVNVRAGYNKVAEDGTVSTQSVGKIAGTSDGIAAYITPVDAGQNFEISAKAHINGIVNNNSQVAFGAICLDQVLSNTHQGGLTFDYVAAGAVKFGETAFVNYTRDRATNALTALTTASYTPQVGDVVDVKITKVGDKFTVTFGDTTNTVEKKMEGTVYFGLYAARCADITFTDLVYSNEVTE